MTIAKENFAPWTKLQGSLPKIDNSALKESICHIEISVSSADGGRQSEVIRTKR